MSGAQILALEEDIMVPEALKDGVKPEEQVEEEDDVDVKEQALTRVISTGHPEIDKKLAGGIPVGSLVLVEGESDAGKSVLCQQIMWGSLSNGVKVLVFTAENTVRSLIVQMDSLGMSILDQLLMGWLKIYALKLSKLRTLPAWDTLQAILEAMEYWDEYGLIIIDSLTPIVSQTSGDEALAYFERCKSLCDKGRTVINVTHTYAFDQDLLVRVRSVSDAHFKLMIEKVGDKLVKTLEVAKIRGASQNTGNILTFDVEPEVGMKIMPISKAKA
jgi:flagellar protein FlaH